METTDFGDRDDRPTGGSRDWSVIWRVFLEAKVRSAPMIVPPVRLEDTPEMRLVDDDHVIETLSCERIEMEARWAAEPQPRFTAAQEAELEAYAPPNSYSDDIKALQMALKKPDDDQHTCSSR